MSVGIEKHTDFNEYFYGVDFMRLFSKKYT